MYVSLSFPTLDLLMISEEFLFNTPPLPGYTSEFQGKLIKNTLSVVTALMMLSESFWLPKKEYRVTWKTKYHLGFHTCNNTHTPTYVETAMTNVRRMILETETEGLGFCVRL